MLRLEDITVTQNRIRSSQSFQELQSKMKDDSDFLRKNPVVLLQTEDGKYWVWNGHTRLAAYWALGFRKLIPEQYYVMKLTYAEVASVNFNVGYVTPFDPKDQCRAADFFEYKKVVRGLFNVVGPWYALKHIVEHSYEYIEERKIHKISKLKLESKV
jgi:hypothetical protein